MGLLFSMRHFLTPNRCYGFARLGINILIFGALTMFVFFEYETIVHEGTDGSQSHEYINNVLPDGIHDQELGIPVASHWAFFVASLFLTIAWLGAIVELFYSGEKYKFYKILLSILTFSFVPVTIFYFFGNAVLNSFALNIDTHTYPQQNFATWLYNTANLDSTIINWLVLLPLQVFAYGALIWVYQKQQISDVQETWKKSLWILFFASIIGLVCLRFVLLHSDLW